MSRLDYLTSTEAAHDNLYVVGAKTGQVTILDMSDVDGQ